LEDLESLVKKRERGTEEIKERYKVDKEILMAEWRVKSNDEAFQAELHGKEPKIKVEDKDRKEALQGAGAWIDPRTTCSMQAEERKGLDKRGKGGGRL